MSVFFAEHELLRACRIIFGSELNVSREFLDYLQLTGIKSAYRKRAFETHPDRAVTRGELVPRRNTDQFRKIQEAYENLAGYLKARENGYRLPPPSQAGAHSPQKPEQRPGRPAGPFAGRGKNRSRTTKNSSSRHGQQQVKRKPYWPTGPLYNGPLPKRKLLFGHFLYYSGVTDWRTIIRALIWQRTQRPRLGELGLRFGMLSMPEILFILEKRPLQQPFGQAAVSLGLLSKQQVKILVHQQKCLQRKFGEFFVEKNLLHPGELEGLLKKYHRHNARFAAPSPASGCN